jgi:hypothetical protein
MGDQKILTEILEEIKLIKTRIRALEKEQRMIKEDILLGNTKERMLRRILEKNPKNIEEMKKEIDKKIQIKM